MRVSHARWAVLREAGAVSDEKTQLSSGMLAAFRTDMRIALGLVACLMACSNNNGDYDGPTAADGALDVGENSGNALGDMAHKKLDGMDTDTRIQSIGAIMHVRNTTQISFAQALQQETQDATATEFATTQIQTSTDNDAVIQGLVPDVQENGVSDQLAAEGKNGTEQLASLDNAEDVAHVYMEIQVRSNEEAYVLAGALLDMDTGGVLDDYLTTTKQMLGAQRDEADRRLRSY